MIAIEKLKKIKAELERRKEIHVKDWLNSNNMANKVAADITTQILSFINDLDVMEINEVNKELYEKAFISDGKYGELNNWKPSINESEIEEWCGQTSEDGTEVWVPATPLGYRDYKESRAEGLANIFAAGNIAGKYTLDEAHLLIRDDNPLKQYDEIIIDDNSYIVTGDDAYNMYIVNEDGHKYSIAYADGLTKIDD